MGLYGNFYDTKKKFAYPMILCGICTILVTLQTLYGFHHPNNFPLPIFNLTLIIFVSSTCGYLYSTVLFLLLFIFKSLLYADVAYTAFVYLLGAIVSYFMAKNKWFASVKKSIFAYIIFIVLFGIVWMFIQNLIEGNGFIHIKGSYAKTFYLLAIPYFLPTILLPYSFLNFTPDSVKVNFPIAFFYTDFAKELEKQKFGKPQSKISSKITWAIVVIACILCIAAALIANMLILNTGKKIIALSPSVTLVFHSIFDVNSILAFDAKLIILMMNVVIPIAIIANYIFQFYIAIPISNMAEYMKNFGQVADTTGDERYMCISCLRDHVNVRSHDEIQELYESLVQTVQQVDGYIVRLEREKQLEADLALARAESKAKSSFLSNMSHEIRTPINAVLGLDEMIIRESSDETIEGYAIDIKNAGKQLLSIINDILDFSKIEAGKMEIIPVEYELSSAINDLVNMTSVRAKDKHLNFFVNTDKNVPHKLYGDEIRLKQVILNILTNAVKYTEKGSVLLTINFEKLDEENVNLLISVQDTGIGIKKEDIEKLYKPFQRVDEERNRTIEGTGLGMTIVQQLLNLMGSAISVQSEYGKGSTFSFAVKQKVLSWDPMGDFSEMYKKSLASAEKYRESFHAPNAKILVVDDTKLNLTVIKGLLKLTQIQVDTASSGAEALKLVVQNKYDILFIDHRMPGMDGIETLHVMQQSAENLNKGVPCVALTANAISGAREVYLHEGFNDYLSKPVDSVKLEKLILRYLPKDLVQKETVLEKPENQILTQEQQPEFFAHLKGIDLKKAIKNCGDSEVFAEAIKDFAEAIPEKSKLIEEYFTAGDFKNYTVLVHALKSSARLIGADELSEQARILEEAGNALDKEKISALTPPLLTLYRSYSENLKSALHSESEKEKPVLEEGKFQSALESIKECVEAFDFDSADLIISELESFKMPLIYEKRYNELRQKIKAVDREAILSLLSNEETVA